MFARLTKNWLSWVPLCGLEVTDEFLCNESASYPVITRFTSTTMPNGGLSTQSR